MKKITEYDYKDVDKAVENFSMYHRNKHSDIAHAFASAHGGLSANLEMLLHRALNCKDEALQEYATEMFERFRDIHLEGENA